MGQSLGTGACFPANKKRFSCSIFRSLFVDPRTCEIQGVVGDSINTEVNSPPMNSFSYVSS